MWRGSSRITRVPAAERVGAQPLGNCDQMPSGDVQVLSRRRRRQAGFLESAERSTQSYGRTTKGWCRELARRERVGKRAAQITQGARHAYPLEQEGSAERMPSGGCGMYLFEDCYF